MTAAKHTAPPWTLKTLAGMGGPQAIIKQLPGGNDRYICLFLSSSGLTAEEQLANATLIQKAPDLLRVLDDVNNALYRVDGDPEGLLRMPPPFTSYTPVASWAKAADHPISNCLGVTLTSSGRTDLAALQDGG